MTTILEKAQEIIYGERAQSYGPFDAEAVKLAAMWSAYLGFEIVPEDVPVMMVLLKVSRLSNDKTHTDSWLDIAGYAGCAGKLKSIWPDIDIEEIEAMKKTLEETFKVPVNVKIPENVKAQANVRRTDTSW